MESLNMVYGLNNSFMLLIIDFLKLVGKIKGKKGISCLKL